MTVLLFHPRFAEPIQSGRKCQTIRPERKRPIKPGDELSLRQWEGKAYRSKQVELLAVKCIAAFKIWITDRSVVALNGSQVHNLDGFARGDGFDSWAEMVAYLEAPGGYGLPFEGVLIQWVNQEDVL
jgi:hypothetical protein